MTRANERARRDAEEAAAAAAELLAAERQKYQQAVAEWEAERAQLQKQIADAEHAFTIAVEEGEVGTVINISIN